MAIEGPEPGNELGEGAQVTEAALATGYASTSAFVAAFGKEMGVTPGQFRRRGGE